MPSQYYEGERFRGLRLVEETFANLTLVDCVFSDCVFESCLVSRCTFTECHFLDCKIENPKFEYSQAKFLELENCVLTQVNWGLLLPSGGFGQPLEKLSACRLKYNFFSNLDLRRFSFAGSVLNGCMFGECNLEEARFGECGLSETEFFRCNLSGADFRNAWGYKVDAPSCTLKGAKFSLPEAASLLDSLGIQLE